ncbi:hypothetical protein [Streptomyces sp. NPDC050164]|uniref:hypothetical protein n=1 Tax=Streptomyces sp. NPDC050164 TaxID=3365605 RepID=UPI00378A9D2B
MADQQYEDAYHAWRLSLRTLMLDAPRLARWQERRFQFAHQVGELLTMPFGGSPATTGPALYGVFLAGVGLGYVGQTLEADRRLRDLPVGESHHLANTAPPEVWDRVVVVRWTDLLASIPETEQTAATELGYGVCGLVLEHRLQLEFSPPLNSRRRHRSGEWRPRDHGQSRSRGAVNAYALPELWRETRATWQHLAAFPPPADGTPILTTAAGRAVFPTAALDRGLTE